MNLTGDFIVAGGFPLGQVPLSSRVAEVEFAISNGAAEIDIVIDRGIAIQEDFQKLYNDLRIIKCVCVSGEVTLKTILSVSELGSNDIVFKTAMTAMMAGSDFIKTSTGLYDNKNIIIVVLVMFMEIVQLMFLIS